MSRHRTRQLRKAEKITRVQQAHGDFIWNNAINAAVRAIGKLNGDAEDVAESAEAHSHQGAYLNAVVDSIEVVGLLRRGR